MFRDECMHTVAHTAMTAHLPPSPSAEPGTILSADMELHMYMQCTFWNRPITGTHVHEQSYYITHYMYIKKGGRERKKKQTLTSLEVHQCIAQVCTHVHPTCQSSYTENKQVHVHVHVHVYTCVYMNASHLYSTQAYLPLSQSTGRGHC